MPVICLLLLLDETVVEFPKIGVPLNVNAAPGEDPFTLPLLLLPTSAVVKLVGMSWFFAMYVLLKPVVGFRTFTPAILTSSRPLLFFIALVRYF